MNTRLYTDYCELTTSHEAQHSQLALAKTPTPEIVPRGVPVTVRPEMPVDVGSLMIQAMSEEYGNEAGRLLSFPLQS